MIGVVFAGVAVVECSIGAHAAFAYLKGKAYESLVKDAATRAVGILNEEQRSRDLVTSIAKLRGALPDDLVDAAEDGRLSLRVDDE